MRLLRNLAGFTALLCSAAGSAAYADDSLAVAYSKILNGDYAASRAAVTHELETNKDDPSAKRVLGWLDSYDSMANGREQLRTDTLNWSSDQAKKADSEGKLFLALTFAARAAEYAPDRAAFAKLDWVKAITDKALTKAHELEAAPKWRDALGYYVRVGQIRDKDDAVKKQREHAARHARLEALYPDKKALDKRIADVRPELLSEAIRQVDTYYCKTPDYKAMALAALENLDALYETPKLFEVFDGLANAETRSKFTAGLKEKQTQIENKDSFDSKELRRLYRDLADLNKKTVDLPEGLVIVEFIEGAITKLDEFTSMIWPADAADFDKALTNEFCGVGISLGVDDIANRLKVVSPLEDSPALEAGILPGDLIIEVDGESTKDWTTEDAVHKITGQPSTNVNLVIFRPSSGQRLEFPLKRREIRIRSIQGYDRIDGDATHWNYMVDKDEGIAYIRLMNFAPRSNQELSAALEEASKQGMRGLILDLRYNPGGLLETAVDICAEFMSKGEMVTTRGRAERTERYPIDAKAPYEGLPLVVLVNDNSASASEILSGACRDYGRAVILGDRTFGKGSVQKVIPLENGGLLARRDRARIKLTTALYYLPSGRSPHKSPDSDVWGVDPDIEVKVTPKEAVKIIDRMRDSGIIRKTATDTPQISDAERKKNLEALKADKKVDDDEDEPLLSEEDIAQIEADPTKAPAVDPQIESALLQLRAKLAAKIPWPKVASHIAENTKGN